VTVDVLRRIAELVRAESGMGLPGERLEALSAALERVRPGVEPIAFLRALERGSDGRALLESLVDEVTVNETYFFRERAQIDAIPWHELQAAAYARGAAKLRVWSAACSTGEEAYTLAISAFDAFGPLPPPVEIVATDIAPSVLVQARGARYRNRSVRELDAEQRERWLVRAGDLWEVAPELRRLVTFSRHNLVRGELPGTGDLFDLVVCRNVLIYFDAATSERVVALLRRALHPGGRLVLGSADALGETSRALAAVTPDAQSGRWSEPLERPRLARDPAPPRPEPLDADACFLQGIADLERGASAEAIVSLRQALWLDSSFGLAAFALGRAHDLAGDRAAAARAYRQALHALGDREAAAPPRDAHELAPEGVAVACVARLAALEAVRW
jgi:chemotaxis protein methyltransferase CheR